MLARMSGNLERSVVSSRAMSSVGTCPRSSRAAALSARRAAPSTAALSIAALGAALWIAALGAALFTAPPAAAQVGPALAGAVRVQTAAARNSARRTGLELMLSGPQEALLGRTARFRGTAYEVRGLATLVALPGAKVSARYATDAADVAAQAPTEVIVGADGRFVVEVPIPISAHGGSRIEFEVSHGTDARSFSQAIALRSPILLDVFADRVLYEPGETVRVWTRVLDATSRAPLVGARTHVTIAELDGATRDVVTAASGVVVTTFEIPESSPEGDRFGSVSVAFGGASQQARNFQFRVGRRSVERLLADITIAPDAPAPEAPVMITVRVRTASGAPVRGAAVTLDVAGAGRVRGTTDADGIARIGTRAPAFLPDMTGWVSVVGNVVHPGHGARALSSGFAIAQPQTLEIGATVPAGGIVPEVDQELWISLLDAAGNPPTTPEPVTVAGPAVRGGSFRGTTDAFGLVAVPIRLPAGAASMHEGATACSGSVATSLDVTVEGEVPRVARLCLAVSRASLLGVRVVRPAVSPGERLEVVIARRPSVAQRPVVVELTSWLGGLPEVLVSRVIGAREVRVTLDVPAQRLGPMQVRARPLGVPGAAEGAGGVDWVMVRPAKPSFVTLALDRDVYPVRGVARLTVTTTAGTPRGWVAVLARDLAAHAGESPFRRTFLDAAFDRALLDPAQPGAERLIRAALAAGADADPAPNTAGPLLDALGQRAESGGVEPAQERGDLRDPEAKAVELTRRGIGVLMNAVEVALEEALASGGSSSEEGDESGEREEGDESGEGGEGDERRAAGDASGLDAVVIGRGRARRFREELLEDALGEDAVTLGGAVAKTSMLTEVDESFTFESVARRVARRRLVRLLASVAAYLDPGEDRESAVHAAPGEPADRWLSRMVQRGLIEASQLRDPWGGHFAMRRAARPAVALGVAAASWELASPGPDGALGNADDVRDPFARAVTAGTPYSVASGEDSLMAALAALAPGAEVLAAIAIAYTRLGEAAREEARGDAAAAGASEFFGTGRGGGGSGEGTIGLGHIGLIGHGSGSGSGSGYGSGAGFGSRSARTSSSRIGSASVNAGGGRGRLSSLVRRRFPATLAFLGDVPLDASGTTIVPLTLADAVTSYRVEAVVWDEAGWAWSESIDLRVDQDIVVDAPVPQFGVVGDRVRLPVRVGNRTRAPIRGVASAAVSGGLGASVHESGMVEVPAGDAIETPVELALDRAGEGVVTVSVRRENGEAVDAVERPLTVLSDTRRLRDSSEALGRGTTTTTLEIPARATPRGTPTVHISTGDAVFATVSVEDPDWTAWAVATAGADAEAHPINRDVALALLNGGIALRGAVDAVARALGALWRSRALTDALAAEGLAALTAAALRTDAQTPRGADRVSVATLASVLLGLAPAARALDARPALRGDLARLVTELRTRLESRATAEGEAPELWAAAAAALALARPDDMPRSRRVDELLRRCRRSVVHVGPDAWLHATGDFGYRRGGAMTSALLAVAEARAGDRDLAFALVRTLRAAAIDDAENGYGARRLGADERALAGLAAALIAAGGRPGRVRPAREATVNIDGREQRVTLAAGVGTIDAPELARPGAHRVVVTTSRDVIVLARADIEVGVPWDVPPRARGPVTLTLDGALGARDTRAELLLEIRSRVPRLVAQPIIELDLPAGAELDEAARAALAMFTVRSPIVAGRTLTLRLRPLRPGGVVKLPIGLRWSVAGALRGLGVSAYASDSPHAATVLRSRAVVIREGGAQ